MKVSRLAFALAVGGILLPGAARSQGFQINEHGMCAVGRGGTGIALPCGDGSSIWFNPAGIAGTRGLTLGLGGHFVAAGGSFTDDFTGRTTKLANTPIPVPHVYAMYGLSERVAVGLGAFVPYGLGTKWPVDFEGRYLGYDNNLRSIYVQPTIAVKVHDAVAIGAGLDMVFGTVKLTQRIDLAPQVLDPATGTTFGQLGIPLGTDFANVQLTGTAGPNLVGHVGVIVQPNEWLRIGAKYMSRTTLVYDGRVDFEPVATGIVLPPGNPISLAEPLLPDDQPLPLDDVLAAQGLFLPGKALADSTGEATITMPDQFKAGIAVRVHPALWILAEWHWTNWSAYEEVVVDFDNAATPDIRVEGSRQDVQTLKGGVEWIVSPRWTLRAGYLRHSPALPDRNVTPLLPEGDRNGFSTGFGLSLGNRYTIDVAYQFIQQDKRRGRVTEPPPGSSAQEVVDNVNSGLFTFRGHQIGTTVTIRFP